jgi:hypothetical protein
MGIFRLKISTIKPLYQRDDKASMTNYRPTALLTTFSKVLEKVMYNRLRHHMHINITLVPEQFGFRKAYPLKIALFSLTSSVFKSINQKMHVGGIFCGLAKALG